MSSRSHALRGNALPDAPRHRAWAKALPIERTRSVPDVRPHAERGNEEPQLLVRVAINANPTVLPLTPRGGGPDKRLRLPVRNKSAPLAIDAPNPSTPPFRHPNAGPTVLWRVDARQIVPAVRMSPAIATGRL